MSSDLLFYSSFNVSFEWASGLSCNVAFNASSNDRQAPRLATMGKILWISLFYRTQRSSELICFEMSSTLWKVGVSSKLHVGTKL
jgi:hypothetical protein